MSKFEKRITRSTVKTKNNFHVYYSILGINLKFTEFDSLKARKTSLAVKHELHVNASKGKGDNLLFKSLE